MEQNPSVGKSCLLYLSIVSHDLLSLGGNKASKAIKVVVEVVEG